MAFAGWTKWTWGMTALAMAAIGGASATLLSGCASEEAADDATSEEEAELRVFPDPSCPGPIAMSKRSFAALPAGYESLSAAEKQAQLWKAVSESAYTPGCKPSSGLFLAAFAAPNSLASMSTTLDRGSDELPAGRRKLVHPFGTIAAFDFVKDPAVAGSPAYTGILAPGGAPVHGIMRPSLGGDPDVIGFTPGVGLKFLVDGKTSVNVVAMNSLMGQKNDTNFLRKPLSNEVPEAHTGLDRGNWLDWAKADSFALAQSIAFLPAMAQGPTTPTPNFLHVDHLAVRGADGRVVPSAERKAPSHLVFRAPERLVAWWESPASRGVDYRDMLSVLPAGTDLYEVYAKETPSSNEVRIGVLRMTTKFVASTWGDYRLFFRHNDYQKNGDLSR